MKYKNYKELFKAYKTGKLTKDTPLIMDNDDCFVYIGDEKVFQGGGQMDVELILDAAGIPNEPC